MKGMSPPAAIVSTPDGPDMANELEVSGRARSSAVLGGPNNRDVSIVVDIDRDEAPAFSGQVSKIFDPRKDLSSNYHTSH